MYLRTGRFFTLMVLFAGVLSISYWIHIRNRASRTMQWNPSIQSRYRLSVKLDGQLDHNVENIFKKRPLSAVYRRTKTKNVVPDAGIIKSKHTSTANRTVKNRNLMEVVEADINDNNIMQIAKPPADLRKVKPFHPANSVSLADRLKRATSRMECIATSTVGHKGSSAIGSLADRLPEASSVNQKQGYIVAVTFREQQTKASENLFSLQCWAKTLRHVSVLEPFMLNSRLLVPLNSSQSSLTRFRDSFDIGVWNFATLQHGFAPLVEWDEFLTKASRQLIVVHFKYPKQRVVVQRKESGEKWTHLAVGNTYKRGCVDTTELVEKLNYLVSTNNFTIVREVCFNFDNGDALTQLLFNSHIYGSYRPEDVTVLMEEWRGFGSDTTGKRIVVLDACATQTPVQSLPYTWPSQRLICDAKKYKHKYLKTDNYIALMVRTEKMKPVGEPMNESHISECLNDTVSLWKKLKLSTGINLTFVAMDIGQYGSTSLTEVKTKVEYLPFVHLYEAFLREIYGPSASIKTWERGFEMITDVRDKGYIGSLQKSLSTKAKCMIFTGGGSFQKHAKFMYERIHPKKANQCIRILDKCSRTIQ